MTPEEQRIALAEWAGWKRPDHPDVMKVKEGWTMPEKWWMCPQGVLRFKHDIPDYLNDLNAVHELIHRLPSGLREVTFVSKLAKVCGFDPQGENAWDRLHAGRFAVVNATATQRCEALLKTLNLWKP